MALLNFISSPQAQPFRHRRHHPQRCHHHHHHPRQPTPRATAQPPDASYPSRDSPPTVLCYGELLQDLHLHHSSSSIPSVVALEKATPRTGGCPANVAICLATLQTPSALLATIAPDRPAQFLLSSLRTRAVNVSAIHIVPSTRTRRVLVVRDTHTGERSFSYPDDTDNNDDNKSSVNNEYPLPFADASTYILHPHFSLFSTAHVYVAGTMALAFDGSAISSRTLLRAARAHGLLTLLDVNWRPMVWPQGSHAAARDLVLDLLSEATVVKASVEDLIFLLGTHSASTALEQPYEALIKLRLKSGGMQKGLLVTDGARGVSYAVGEMDSKQVLCGSVKAFLPPGGVVVDTTGAGDAFVAGFVAELLTMADGCDVNDALLDRERLHRAVRFAAAVAAVVVGGEGAVDPLLNRAQVEAVLG